MYIDPLLKHKLHPSTQYYDKMIPYPECKYLLALLSNGF
jgi:hypothetical protein